MIRKTLAATKEATFSVDLPLPPISGPPSPSGTGFFVSADGWFLIAAHIVTDQAGHGRTDVAKGDLNRPTPTWMESCDDFTLDHFDTQLDYAIPKVALAKNKTKDWLNNGTGFPFLQVSILCSTREKQSMRLVTRYLCATFQQSGPFSFSSEETKRAWDAERMASEFIAQLGRKVMDVAGKMREGSLHEAVRTTTNKVADKLDSAGAYLEERKLENLVDDAVSVIRKYPVQSVLLV